MCSPTMPVEQRLSELKALLSRLEKAFFTPGGAVWEDFRFPPYQICHYANWPELPRLRDISTRYGMLWVQAAILTREAIELEENRKRRQEEGSTV